MQNDNISFTTEFLKSIGIPYGYGSKDTEQAVIIEDKISDQERWYTAFDMVFLYKEKYYKTTYYQGSTESQEHDLWNYGDPEVIEVEPTIVSVTQYLPKHKT